MGDMGDRSVHVGGTFRPEDRLPQRGLAGLRTREETPAATRGHLAQQARLEHACDKLAASPAVRVRVERLQQVARRDARVTRDAHPREQAGALGVGGGAALGDGVMIVTLEYDGFVVAGGAQKDRLDVLGLDPDGHLIVAELKRGIAPDTVEMQAVKYAAMASRFTLKTLASAFAAFKSRRGMAMAVDGATEALQTHAPALSDETLGEPRVVVVAQGFSPVVISSVVWLKKRGVDISLVRFQPYQTGDGQVFVTFSRLFPLPELPIVAPGTPIAEVPTNALHSVEWTTADLVALGRIANLTTRTTLDLCAERPDTVVSLTEIVETAGVTRPAGRAQLAGLTMVVKNRFGRRNWPFAPRWAADGTPQAFYAMSVATAARWRDAAIQLDAEQSDRSVDGELDDEQAVQDVGDTSE